MVAMETKTCPYCKSEIPSDALVCRYCQRNYVTQEQAQKSVGTERTNSQMLRMICIAIGILFMILAFNTCAGAFR
jgi:RNA polymerase subunit RPABC4/transcription elongation factor Spt4